MALIDRLAFITVNLAVMSLSSSSLLAEPMPPREGCRPVSKIEYNSAKRELLLESRVRVYVRTGPFWRRHYWHCPK